MKKQKVNSLGVKKTSLFSPPAQKKENVNFAIALKNDSEMFPFTPWLLIFAALAGVFASCGGDMKREDFCGEMADEFCAKLFDSGCEILESGEDGVGYSDEDACVDAEESACDKISKDKTIKFDADEASSCIDSIKSADCTDLERSEFHDCDKVFDDTTPPVTELSVSGSGEGDDNE